MSRRDRPRITPDLLRRVRRWAEDQAYNQRLARRYRMGRRERERFAGLMGVYARMTRDHEAKRRKKR